MSLPIIDFHADLLAYLAKEADRSPLDKESRCSLPELMQGNVQVQILPLFTQTEDHSIKYAEEQIKWFKKLSSPSFPSTLFFLSIENASSLSLENEPLELFFSRLSTLNPSPIYISLTWNDENRFGGGNNTMVGLKADGKKVLNFLSGKQIAIDISHASDPLAYDIFNHIEKEGLDITPIASHSNCRHVCHKPRNLPDDLILHIIQKKGVIGLNFVRHFVGHSIKAFYDHIDHLLTLQAQDHIVIGSDFFGGILFSFIEPLLPIFFQELSSSASLPYFLNLLESKYSKAFIEKIAYHNALRFLEKKVPNLSILDGKISLND